MANENNKQDQKGFSQQDNKSQVNKGSQIQNTGQGLQQDQNIGRDNLGSQGSEQRSSQQGQGQSQGQGQQQQQQNRDDSGAV